MAHQSVFIHVILKFNKAPHSQTIMHGERVSEIERKNGAPRSNDESTGNTNKKISAYMAFTFAALLFIYLFFIIVVAVAVERNRTLTRAVFLHFLFRLFFSKCMQVERNAY